MAAGQQMVTFNDLITHSSMGRDACTFARRLLGVTWDSWFTKDPIHDDIIPRQTCLLILTALEMNAKAWEKVMRKEENVTAAKEAAEGVDRAAKKRRQQLYEDNDADMDDL